MKIKDIMSDFNLDEEVDLFEKGKATKSFCQNTLVDKQGASQHASCVAQGFNRRKDKRKKRVGNKPKSVYGKKVKSSKYGGPLKDQTSACRKSRGGSWE